MYSILYTFQNFFSFFLLTIGYFSLKSVLLVILNHLSPMLYVIPESVKKILNFFPLFAVIMAYGRHFPDNSANHAARFFV
jgi:hypothetical protein